MNFSSPTEKEAITPYSSSPRVSQPMPLPIKIINDIDITHPIKKKKRE